MRRTDNALHILMRPNRKRVRAWHFVVLCVVVLGLWGLNWWLLQRSGLDAASRGQFGDMFGGVNALFTALAFAGLAYTILLQREELEESSRTQERFLLEQQRYQEEQRVKQEDSLRSIEASRQQFLDNAERQRKEQEEQREKQFSDNVLRAIRCELEALGPIYQQGMGGHTAPLVDGQVLDVRLALTQEWFVVFAANAIHLGRLDGKLSRKIVTVYALLKLLVEEFRINNEYLATREEVDSKIRERPNELHLQKKLGVVHGWMVKQAINIRRTELLVKGAVEDLLKLLDEAGIT